MVSAVACYVGVIAVQAFWLCMAFSSFYAMGYLSIIFERWFGYPPQISPQQDH